VFYYPDLIWFIVGDLICNFFIKIFYFNKKKFILKRYGQLGTEDTVSKNYPVPVKMNGPIYKKKIEIISCGANHNCVTTNDKKVFCWGWNMYDFLFF